ncbi:hypothetical protein ACOMHN_032153 [Nucella lapillus]
MASSPETLTTPTPTPIPTPTPTNPTPTTTTTTTTTTLLPNQRKTLKCGICQDIFRSPKILPCFHTFCLLCLEQLVAVKGSPFQCPSCRKITHVPPGEGPKGFQSNMYITESELERARENVTVCRVHVNHDEPLAFFCLTCNDAICLMCKLTKHEGHRCEDLLRADERGKRLARANIELKDVTKLLKDNVSHMDDHLKQIDHKKAVLVQQVNDRHDYLVTIATQWKNKVLKDLDKSTEVIKSSMISERDDNNFHLRTCRTQRKRVQQIMDTLSKDTLDVAEADRVLRTCSDIDNLRKRLKMPTSESLILRPGLYCSMETIGEDLVHRWIGTASVLKMPHTGPARETLSLFYQCLQDRKPRQVLALCVTNDSNVHCMYEDLTGGISQWGKRIISSTGQVVRDNKVREKFVFRKFANGGKICISHHKVTNGICLNSKSGSAAQIQYKPSSSSDDPVSCSLRHIHVGEDPVLNNPKLSGDEFVQNIHTGGRPLAVDVTSDGSLLAVVEESVENASAGEDQTQSGPSRRLVRLYRRGQEDCIATYQPPDPASFLPTDVCFWRHGGRERLLVGDYNNDSVHVINVHVINAHRGRCVLERYLAPGCGALVKPTAFDTDSKGRLWIGSTNGWILKCEALPGTSEIHDGDDIKNVEVGKHF